MMLGVVDNEELHTRESALKKLMSNIDRHSSAVESEMRFTSPKVPWLMIKPSSLENESTAVEIIFSPI